MTTVEAADWPYFNISQGRFWISIHVNDLAEIGEAIVDGLEAWAESAVTSTTRVSDATVHISTRGAVRLSRPIPGGRERWLVIESVDAIDLANELLSVAAE